MGVSEKLSIIILMHNNIDMSRRCLEALSGAVSGLDHEVILLDNGSTEDSAPLREYAAVFHRFRMIRNDVNTPFSIINNRCVRESTGRFLLFLNNDVFLGRNGVKELMAPLLEDESIGVTGGKLLFPGETAVQHAGIGQMLWDHPSNYGVGANPSDGRIQEKCERFALSGAMLCLRRETFEKIGGFDERYVWGTEDIDLCLKVRSTGQKAIYCPKADAIHCESATLKVTHKWDPNGNCRLYRQIWNPVLVPAEQKYVRCLKDGGIRRIAVFGMGTAARGLARILDGTGIQIVAFTSSGSHAKDEQFLERPALPLEEIRGAKYDRLIVASQFFFQVEDMVRDCDPLGKPIYPMLN